MVAKKISINSILTSMDKIHLVIAAPPQFPDVSDILQSSKLNSSVVEHEHDVILCEQQEVDKQLERWSLTTFMQLLSKICVPQLFCMQ